MRPQLLPPNLLHHFYAGGARLSSLRGVRIDDDHTPEEWLGAVNDDVRGARRPRALGSTTARSCATRSRRTRWRGSARSTSRATARTPAC